MYEPNVPFQGRWSVETLTTLFTPVLWGSVGFLQVRPVVSTCGKIFTACGETVRLFSEVDAHNIHIQVLLLRERLTALATFVRS